MREFRSHAAEWARAEVRAAAEAGMQEAILGAAARRAAIDPGVTAVPCGGVALAAAGAAGGYLGGRFGDGWALVQLDGAEGALGAFGIWMAVKPLGPHQMLIFRALMAPGLLAAPLAGGELRAPRGRIDYCSRLPVREIFGLAVRAAASTERVANEHTEILRGT